MNDATIRIEQKRFLRGSQTLILSEDTLKIESRRGLSVDEYRFDLRGLMPDPVRMKNIPVAKIFESSALTVLGVVFLAAGAGWLAEAHALLLQISLLICATLAWSSVVRKTVNVVLFRGPGGQIVLWPDHPDKEELKAFLTTLRSRIRDARHPEQDVVRHLRRAEIIDDWQYEQAMELVEQKA